ncbi:hypothetical protein EVAR_17777_1 [Eumeta japonica]|uniref:Uncharacterized protein n=1 Tax=Eumeta variegata TaxID=151549 RepID=A0A4C1TTR1_EUMVA|nr:hypothetical protein EVAR_17777_1 [Eumeta japonica]
MRCTLATPSLFRAPAPSARGRRAASAPAVGAWCRAAGSASPVFHGSSALPNSGWLDAIRTKDMSRPRERLHAFPWTSYPRERHTADPRPGHGDGRQRYVIGEHQLVNAGDNVSCSLRRRDRK